MIASVDHWGYILGVWAVTVVAIGGYAIRVGAAGTPALTRGSSGVAAMDVTEPPGSLADDEAGTDAGIDLTPRDVTPRRRRGRRSTWGIVAGVVVLAAVGIVLWNGLTQATVFFYNVDQAVVKRGEIGTKDFRIQGNVVKGSVHQQHEHMNFELTFNGKTVPVSYTGEPSELFGPAIPVVLEGHFSGNSFASDQMLIRHDNDYDQKNPTRVRQAEKDAEKQS